MKSEKFALAHIEGQFLLRYANLKVPTDLAGEKLDPGVAVNANDQIVLLRRDLRAHSPMIQREQKPCFGSPANWAKKVTPVFCAKCKEGSPLRDSDSWDMVDPYRKIEVRLSEDAVSGIFWCLLIAMGGGHALVASNAEIDELVMPLANRFGWTSELKRAMKLDRAKARTLVREAAPEKEPVQVDGGAAS